jgi:hypothetical protein
MTLSVLFTQNAFLIRMLTSKELVFADVPSVLFHSPVFFLFCSDSCNIPPAVIFVLILVDILSVLLHSHISLSVLNTSCTREADTTTMNHKLVDIRVVTELFRILIL